MKCQSECDTYGDGKMRVVLVGFWMLFTTTNASADGQTSNCFFFAKKMGGKIIEWYVHARPIVD